jgi:hypothetical protein
MERATPPATGRTPSSPAPPGLTGSCSAMTSRTPGRSAASATAAGNQARLGHQLPTDYRDEDRLPQLAPAPAHLREKDQRLVPWLRTGTKIWPGAAAGVGALALSPLSIAAAAGAGFDPLVLGGVRDPSCRWSSGCYWRSGTGVERPMASTDLVPQPPEDGGSALGDFLSRSVIHEKAGASSRGTCCSSGCTARSWSSSPASWP